MAEPPLSVHQLGATDLPDLTNVGGPPRYACLDDLPQNHRPRLVALHIDHRISVDQYERNSWILRPAVPFFAFIAEPDLPVRLVEGLDAMPVARDAGNAANGDPFARFVVVVGAVDVG